MTNTQEKKSPHIKRQAEFFNLKYITIQKIGYNSPSQANWSYGIWQVNAINTTREYSAGYTVRDSFGGYSRFITKARDAGYKVISLSSVYPLQKFVGIRSIKDIEADDFLASLIKLF